VSFTHPANRKLSAHLAGCGKADRVPELNPADVHDFYVAAAGDAACSGNHRRRENRWFKGEDQWCRAAFDAAGPE
jgi:hypothetical protein